MCKGNERMMMESPEPAAVFEFTRGEIEVNTLAAGRAFHAGMASIPDEFRGNGT
jgi:hypothetical protein